MMLEVNLSNRLVFWGSYISQHTCLKNMPQELHCHKNTHEIFILRGLKKLISLGTERFLQLLILTVVIGV